MYGVGGLDDVAFVGDSHRCRAPRSSWRAFESCWLVMGW